MNHSGLFEAVRPLVRDGGGIVIVTNGTPLWLQENNWFRALRAFLGQWLNTELTYACGTDDHTQQRYAEDLAAAGFEVHSTSVDHVVELDLDQLIGGVYSAIPVTWLPPPDERASFAAAVRTAVAPDEHFQEHVHVAMLIGKLPVTPRPTDGRQSVLSS